MPQPNAIAEQLQGLVHRSNGLVTKYAALAEQMNVAEDLVHDAVATLKQQGRLRVLSAGRQGVRLTPSAAPPSAQPRETQTEAETAPRLPRPARRAPQAPRRASASRASYCPWCGMAAGSDWTYCGGCGKGLPETR